MLFCFRVGVEFISVVSCVDQVFDRPGKITSPLEMYRKLGSDLWRAPPVMLRQKVARLEVQRNAALVYQVRVQMVLVEGVSKTIARSKVSIRQFLLATGLD